MSAVRDRTLHHLRGLARATAVIGASSQLCYCVVDMVPAPAACADVGKDVWSSLFGYAGWSGADIWLTLGLADRVVGVDFPDTITLTGGTVVSVTSDEGGSHEMTVVFTPEPGVETAEFDVHLLCGEDAADIHVTVTFDPADTDSVPVVSVDPG
jgi:hypothetical protein